MSAPRVLVLTVVHHPLDARIRARQVEALRAAGWEVTYAAPWTGHGLDVPAPLPGLTCLDVPRARGRRRLGAQRGARRLLRREAARHDLVLVHDPELLLAVLGLRLPPVVWDVHEDTAAAVEVRPWVPDRLRRPLAGAVRRLERAAERRWPLLLADARYADRFVRDHPVVPNSTTVPPSPAPAAVPDEAGRLRVVYLGSITMERGAGEVVEVARALRARLPGRTRVEVVGSAHGSAGPLLREADAAGDLTWHGYLPNEEALRRVDGALAGLSLLHDEANFRPSMPTKVVEYLARGVPAVTTPLPLAQDLVLTSGGGAVVPFGAVAEVVDVLAGWVEDPEGAREAGRRGHAHVARAHSWQVDSVSFVAALRSVLDGPPAVRRGG